MKILRTFVVSPATAISFLILPFVVGIYYCVAIYTDRFVNQSNLTFFDVQNTVLTSFFLEQKWIAWLNRFMDFAFWGVIAAAVIIAGWLFSAARVAIHNHYAEESFVHFKVPKGSWHSHFAVVAFLKILLIFGILYSVAVFVGQAVPLLAANIGTILLKFNWSDVWAIGYTVLLMMFLQYLVVTCVKLFRIIQTDA